MVTIDRVGATDDEYAVRYGVANLSDVAVRAKPMPAQMLAPGGVTDAFLDYARPLVGELEHYSDLAALPLWRSPQGAIA